MYKNICLVKEPYLWLRKELLGTLSEGFFNLQKHFNISVHTRWVWEIKASPKSRFT